MTPFHPKRDEKTSILMRRAAGHNAIHETPASTAAKIKISD